MDEMCEKVSSTISKSLKKINSTLHTKYRERDEEVVFVWKEQAKKSDKLTSSDLHVPPSSCTAQLEPVHVSIELCDETETAPTTYLNKLLNIIPVVTCKRNNPKHKSLHPQMMLTTASKHLAYVKDGLARPLASVRSLTL